MGYYIYRFLFLGKFREISFFEKFFGLKGNFFFLGYYKMGGFRLWCFTNYDLSFDYEAYMERSGAQYVAWGDEVCPTTNRQHHQGFVYFAVQKTSKKNVAADLGKSHVEPCRGSLTDNEAYCAKEGSYHELGVKPAQGARADLKDLKDEIVAGKRSVDDITMDDPMVYHQYGRTLEKIEDIALRKKFRTEMTVGIWYYGETCGGKSHNAYENFDPATHYVWKDDNGWQDGYAGQETVVIDDFRGGIPYNELLRIVDKWPYTLRRRNREPVPFLAKTVIVTSSLPPNMVYKNLAANDSLAQLLRRFEVIEWSSESKVLAQKCSEGNTGTSEPFFDAC